MRRQPLLSTLTYTLFPSTPPFRPLSPCPVGGGVDRLAGTGGRARRRLDAARHCPHSLPPRGGRCVGGAVGGGQPAARESAGEEGRAGREPGAQALTTPSASTEPATPVAFLALPSHRGPTFLPGRWPVCHHCPNPPPPPPH